MSGSIGPLLDADEHFNHQIVETFASVLQSDYSWTEKVCGIADSRPHLLKARAIGDTGFHLGAGLYRGFDGKYHGSYRGRLAVEGEYIADCSTPEAVARLNQFRDCLIVVEDTETGATGWGNCQTYVTGQWPEMGLANKD